MTQGPAAPAFQSLAQSKARCALVFAVFMAGYLAVGLRLADLTLLRAGGEAAATAAAGPVLRGDILDRNGVLLATSLRMASVYADATLVESPGELAGALAAILPGEDRAALAAKLSSGKKFVWIRRDITPRQEYAINALGAPALGFHEEGRRIYPAGALAAHVTGYADVDGRGIAGAEKFFDEKLAAGAAPLRLTLDLRVQHILHRALDEAVRRFSAKGGAGIVMDAQTGEVIALVSLPDFDPHRPAAAPAAARFNNATLGVFEPGSTFKLFSVAAALDSGRVGIGASFDAVEPIRYGRFTISDFHPEKRVLTVPEIFIHSSNIGTARMAMTLGTQALRDFYEKMGFFAPVPLDLPETGAPLHPKAWRDVHALTASFGHGVAVSPLHIARGAAALVNGGRLVAPRLAADGGQADPAPQVVRPETALLVRRLLSLTVTDGTGGKAAAAGYDVGGKTGTAEKNLNGHYIKKAVISSFLGAFPMARPRYIVYAMLDEPQPVAETHGYVTGGWTAAPVVARVIEQMAPLYGMRPGTDGTLARELRPYVKGAKEEKSVVSFGTDR